MLGNTVIILHMLLSKNLTPEPRSGNTSIVRKSTSHLAPWSKSSQCWHSHHGGGNTARARAGPVSHLNFGYKCTLSNC